MCVDALWKGFVLKMLWRMSMAEGQRSLDLKDMLVY